MFKHYLIFVLLVIPTLSCFALLGGQGTEENPYLITSYDDLIELSTTPSYWITNSYFIQTNDIDATNTCYLNNGEGFSSIGFHPNYFNGNYDGQGYSISNIYINKTTICAALFGWTENAEIKNTNIIDINISCPLYSAGIIGVAYSSTVINCSSSGYITSTNSTPHCAGIVGVVVGDCKILNSYSSVTIDGNAALGGITNLSTGFLEIENCYFTGIITGNTKIGGIIGQNHLPEHVTIRNCYVKASITSGAPELSGVIIGDNKNSTITSCVYQDNGSLQGVGTESQISDLPESSILALSESEMKMADSYINLGWDLNTMWLLDDTSINNGYPYLYWQQTDPYEIFLVEDDNQCDFTANQLNTDIHFINPLPNGSQLMINQLGCSNTSLNGISSSNQPLGNNFWRIKTNYQDTISYQITFNLQEIATSFNNNEVAVYKRSNPNEAWQNVIDLGALVSCHNNKITVTGLTSFSDFIPVLEDSTLPVELSSFNANLINNSVQLTWQVESESNLIGYYLLTGITNNIDSANLIPSLIHATNSPHHHEYKVQHKPEISPNINTAYYWLKSIEQNNNATYYGPIMVKFNNNIDNHPQVEWGSKLFTNYPNPFNPTTTITFSVKKPQNVKISIYNLRGQLVKTILNQFVSQAQKKYKIIWDGTDINNNQVASSNYILRMKLEDQEFSRKILMQK